MANLIIAIDGNSGSGKGTLSRKLAQHYNLKYLDTGKLYRIIAYRVKILNIDFYNEKEVAKIAKSLKLQDLDLMNNATLKSEDIASIASLISGFKDVRENLLNVQREFASNGAILDGRDIGTVILPNADVKIFLHADINVRAKRRFNESLKLGIECKFEEILQKMLDRDYRDANRAESPLICSEDSILIDTTNLDKEKTFKTAIDLIDKKLFEKKNI